jgi:glycosyltransferase involved in cell wall biosynthesis
MLSLCMIVKDEENNLRRCLESVKNFVDEMIIVDTGSVDSTAEIAESFGAKVFFFKWTGSFSDARNFSLKQAEGDWILLMDADDEMEEMEPEKIRRLMEDTDADAYFFETISYIGKEPGNDAARSMNLRLLRNNRGYFFVNPVHEQIYGTIMSVNPRAKIINSDLKVYHYGYLSNNIAVKNKRARNIALLEKELKKTPGYAFALFNLGGEYCAMEDYEKALEYFGRAYRVFNPNEGYAHVLIFKMANCYLLLKRYGEALKICDSGLEYYPEFTDLEFIKGAVFSESGDNMSALKHFEKCCEMGEAPNYLNIVVGAGTYRPLSAIGEIYFERGDYDTASRSLMESLTVNPGFKHASEVLVRIYCRMIQDDGELVKSIEKLNLSDPEIHESFIMELLTQENRMEALGLFLDE